MSGAGYYGVFAIPLDTAGEKVVAIEVDRIHFLRAEVSGAIDLDTEISVRLSEDQGGDYIPLSVNSTVVAKTKRFTLSWAAQANAIAYIVVSRGAVQISSPPTRQIVSSSSGTSLSAAAVTVGTSAVLLAAAASGRQSVAIQNLGSVDVFIGGAGVTTGAGIKIAAGTGFTVDKTTAAIYGIAGSAGQDVRVLTEG